MKRRFVQYQWLVGFVVLGALILFFALPGYALQSFVNDPNISPSITNAPPGDDGYDLVLDTRGAIAEVLTNDTPTTQETSPEKRNSDLF